MVEAAVRGFHAQEDAARWARGPIGPQVRDERFAHVPRQWKAIVHRSLSSHRQLAGSPVEIAQLQPHHLAGAKAQSRQ
jgi:hypothetical protein